jgi:hypothetical protein
MAIAWMVTLLSSVVSYYDALHEICRFFSKITIEKVERRAILHV